MQGAYIVQNSDKMAPGGEKVRVIDDDEDQRDGENDEKRSMQKKLLQEKNLEHQTATEKRMLSYISGARKTVM